MPTFGLSAYLKLISLSRTRQKSELRKRLMPRDGPYDFHRSLRLLAKRLLAKGEGVETILRAVESITQKPERNSAREGLEALVNWRIGHPAELFDVPNCIFVSPARMFKIAFVPDFGIVIDGKRCAVHLWNTKTPALDERLTQGTLSMLEPLVPNVDNLVVLSLRTSQLIWSENDGRYAAMGYTLVQQMEGLFEEVKKEIRAPTKRQRIPPTPPSPTA